VKITKIEAFTLGVSFVAGCVLCWLVA